MNSSTSLSPNQTPPSGRSASQAAADPSAGAGVSGGRFARLPRLAGHTFIPLGLLARLPLAMLTVGTLTLVTSNSGSYSLGGMAAGAAGDRFRPGCPRPWNVG